MNYNGTFEVKSSRDRVYAFATDPIKVTTIFPDVQDIQVIDSDNFLLKAKVGIGFVKGLMDIRCVITEKTPSKHVKLKANGTGLSSAVELESDFTLDDTPDGGTLVRWKTEAKISGLMARVGSRIMDSVASKYINQIIESLKEKLS